MKTIFFIETDINMGIKFLYSVIELLHHITRKMLIAERQLSIKSKWKENKTSFLSVTAYDKSILMVSPNKDGGSGLTL